MNVFAALSLPPIWLLIARIRSTLCSYLGMRHLLLICRAARVPPSRPLRFGCFIRSLLGACIRLQVIIGEGQVDDFDISWRLLLNCLRGTSCRRLLILLHDLYAEDWALGGDVRRFWLNSCDGWLFLFFLFSSDLILTLLMMVHRVLWKVKEVLQDYVLFLSNHPIRVLGGPLGEAQWLGGLLAVGL